MQKREKFSRTESSLTSHRVERIVFKDEAEGRKDEGKPKHNQERIRSRINPTRQLEETSSANTSKVLLEKNVVQSV